MIFLTVGTHQPFPRLVQAVDEWCAAQQRDDLFGQISGLEDAGYTPQHFEWVARLDPVEFNRKFDQASLIIAHAGMGTIISSLSAGKPVVILPRRAHLHEMRNDHQWATAQHLQDRPGIHVAWEADQISEVIAQAEAEIGTQGGALLPQFAGEAFTGALRKLILNQAEP